MLLANHDCEGTQLWYTNNYFATHWRSKMKYRKRIPSRLVPYVSKNEIKKVVKSKAEAISIDLKIENALNIVESNFSDLTKREMIAEELKGYLELKEIDKGVQYFEAAKLYLEQSSVSKREEKNRDYFFNDLLPALLKYVYSENPEVSKITPKHLNKIASIIQKLPSRNHLDLKRISSYQLIQKTLKGEYDDYKKLHIDTANKMIKRIRSLALYGFRSGLFTMSTAISTAKHQYSARDQRKALTLDEVQIISEATKIEELKNFIDILRYTGMRLGELTKYKIKTIDGIKCFDLRDADSLKTMSSFRIIPMHPKLKKLEFAYTPEHLARKVKQLINENLEDSEKKTTYSLRHTFASELIKNDVSSEIVSELLGHKHMGMTLSRYAKGFSTKQLYDAIATL